MGLESYQARYTYQLTDWTERAYKKRNIDYVIVPGTTIDDSEAIVTENYSTADRFVREVEASAVMVNASTRFNDGGQFGLGAEVAISTNKMHARGPMGLKEITSYKWVVLGNGQIRQ